MPRPTPPCANAARIQFRRNAPQRRVALTTNVLQNRSQTFRKRIGIRGDSFPKSRAAFPCPPERRCPVRFRDGDEILGFLMPVFIDIMMDNPNENWGKPFYPVVK